MKEVVKIFKQIQETSSLNDKKSIIVANKDNELFKKCLVFLLDGNVITGLSAKKIAKKVTKSEYILPTFEDVMKYLAQNNTGTDNDISMIQAFLNEHGGETAITEALSGMTVDTTTAVPARKKKLPFYIVPEKLDEVELTDTCMLSELTNRINALCEEPDRKKLTAAFVNQLLVEKGYLEEVLQGEEKVKRVTEKGKAAGILEEERRAKYGKNYYAMIHTRESQRMILKKLQDYCSKGIQSDERTMIAERLQDQ